MLSPINEPPHSITPEEHAQITSSTPSSFVDIPPILRWADDVEVDVTLSPLTGGWEGWASSNGRVKGKLSVNEISVAFIPTPSSQIKPGFNLPFPSLTLHALTPASADGIPAHLYCQVDESDAPSLPSSSMDAGPSGSSTTSAELNGHAPVNGAGPQPIDVDVDVDGEDKDGDADENEDEDDDEGYIEEEEEFTPMREIRIYLESSKLESLFSALSFCSALHDSVLPNGEPSSFFGFGAGDDDDDDAYDGEEGQWEDADADDDAAQRQEQGQGRIIYFDPKANAKSERESKGKSGAVIGQKSKAHNDNEGEGEVTQVVDQMQRFLNLVDWGDVPKPAGWDDTDDQDEVIPK
ncbi:uncharacterized protein I303_101127 [Kwoniella dejecticola CBS 10117]|uniref:Chloride channel, nucleotide-sensitive, 1A n=1 Tax=Kwoniella dejecticola CBS 10117 TaxID=1296121 RepID=A0A1A6AGW2_9TREE|nr:chloride channel, nucleotide-sensitive, 1A [Kwoniella dejecticola CBS 10117]OBR89307.1 chloride channel, nucleotide-sensitive, 1A [Kwoniella dejecticola CBS 10117]